MQKNAEIRHCYRNLLVMRDTVHRFNLPIFIG